MYLMYTLYTGKDATASSYSALAVSSSWLTTSSSFSMTPTRVTKHSTVQYVQEGCKPRRCRFAASCWLGALLEWGPVCICPTARHAAVRGNSSYGPQTAMRHSSTSGQPTPVGSVGSGGSQWAAHQRWKFETPWWRVEWSPACACHCRPAKTVGLCTHSLTLSLGSTLAHDSTLTTASCLLQDPDPELPPPSGNAPICFGDSTIARTHARASHREENKVSRRLPVGGGEDVT
jgi:hypothetical protein